MRVGLLREVGGKVWGSVAGLCRVGLGGMLWKVVKLHVGLWRK
jgi:hypothetical protein